MAQIRPVYPVHRALGQLRTVLGSMNVESIASQYINHQGVEVGNLDPVTNTITTLTRFGLEKVNEHGRDVVRLRFEPNADPSEYKGVSFFPGIHLLPPIVGWTSLTDAEIRRVADDLISQHGQYQLLTNSCQHWAKKFFHTICDVKGSRRARFSYHRSEKGRGKDYRDQLYVLVVDPIRVYRDIRSAASYAFE